MAYTKGVYVPSTTSGKYYIFVSKDGIVEYYDDPSRAPSDSIFKGSNTYTPTDKFSHIQIALDTTTSNSNHPIIELVKGGEGSHPIIELYEPGKTPTQTASVWVPRNILPPDTTITCTPYWTNTTQRWNPINADKSDIAGGETFQEFWGTQWRYYYITFSEPVTVRRVWIEAPWLTGNQSDGYGCRNVSLYYGVPPSTEVVVGTATYPVGGGGVSINASGTISTTVWGVATYGSYCRDSNGVGNPIYRVGFQNVEMY